MAPVPGLIFRPAGKPSAKYFSVPLPESLALIDSDTVLPSVLVWLLGVVIVTVPVPVIVQVKVSTAVFVPSFTVTVVVKEPMVAAPEVMVPEISPVDVLMPSPVGKPLAA